MRREIYLGLIILVILVSGCTSPTGENQENDNALLIGINPHKVKASWEFDVPVKLTSQVTGDIKDVRVQIANLDGLNLIGVFCTGGQPVNNEYCKFDAIEGFGDRKATFRMQAPSEQELGGVGTTKNPKFVVGYQYVGETVFNIPIVKSGIGTELNPVYAENPGPIKARITKGTSTTPEESEEKIGPEIEVEGSVFPITLQFVDEVSGDNSNVVIRKGNFALKLSHFSVLQEEAEDCQFDYSGRTLKLEDDVRVADGKEFSCALQTDPIDLEIVMGSISTSKFTYTYQLDQTVPVEITITVAR